MISKLKLVIRMRVVLQVVKEASVSVDDKVVSNINKGFLLLVGIMESDTIDNVVASANKIAGLRVFHDENGKTNLSLNDVKGSILSVSQFTLCADISKGNRPSFVNAAKRDKAIEFYNKFNELLKSKGFEVKEGIFGASMSVKLVNDGPFTLVVEN